MSQHDKSRYFQALKEAGVEFSKHYREYTEAELALAYGQLQDALEEQAHAGPSPEPPALPIEVDEPLPSLDDIMEMHRPDPAPVSPTDPGPDNEPIVPAEPAFDPAKLREAAANFSTGSPLPVEKPKQVAPRRERDPEEVAGARLNTHDIDEPLRTDEQGRIWFQEEVLKPAFPKPRGRRVLRYNDPGVVEKTTTSGQFTETFEVPGTRVMEAEVKITLPSYQVGIYKDPRFPFRIHTYNGLQGFDLFEVQKYYGGSELVPAGIKKTYVENALCYDVRTVIRAIQEEFRQLQLTGRIKL